jgi:hypothetical protein
VGHRAENDIQAHALHVVRAARDRCRQLVGEHRSGGRPPRGRLGEWLGTDEVQDALVREAAQLKVDLVHVRGQLADGEVQLVEREVHRVEGVGGCEDLEEALLLLLELLEQVPPQLVQPVMRRG